MTSMILSVVFANPRSAPVLPQHIQGIGDGAGDVLDEPEDRNEGSDDHEKRGDVSQQKPFGDLDPTQWFRLEYEVKEKAGPGNL